MPPPLPPAAPPTRHTHPPTPSKTVLKVLRIVFLSVRTRSAQHRSPQRVLTRLLPATSHLGGAGIHY